MGLLLFLGNFDGRLKPVLSGKIFWSGVMGKSLRTVLDLVCPSLFLCLWVTLKLILTLGVDVKIICRLRTDMRTLPNEAFERRKRFGGLKRFYEASYLVNMIIRPADLKFEMWFKNSLQSELLDISWEFGGNLPRNVQIDQVQTSPRSSRVNAFRWLSPNKFPEQAFAESSAYGLR